MSDFYDKLEALGKRLGHNTQVPRKSYQQCRAEYDVLANDDITKLQSEARQQRISQLIGQSDLNPEWVIDTFETKDLDAKHAYVAAKTFKDGHSDTSWCEHSHMLVFYGDYGRGKSHLAGAIAHRLIEENEVTVLYRQLSTLLDMKIQSHDFKSNASGRDEFKALTKLLLSVDLLILDEVCVNESKLSPSAQSWLGDLLRRRYAKKRHCIFITNHNIEALHKALGNYCFESIKQYHPEYVRFFGASRRG